MGSPTILVKIASYRDSELPKTVASCLERAAHPDRLRFAIVNQMCDRTKNQLDEYQGDERFTFFLVDWSKSQGLGWARKLTDGMWRGEDFSLQIDSHTVFEDGWDASLIEQWGRLDDPMAVLSSYPPAYRYNSDGEVELAGQTPNQATVKGYEYAGIPRFKGVATAIFSAPVPFVSGGMQFGPGESCAVLPQLAAVFTGDEVAQALRLFTHGYSVYPLEHCPVYHLYLRHEHFTDVEYAFDNFQTSQRLKQIFDFYLTRSINTVQEVITGSNPHLLGTVRSLNDFHTAFPGAFPRNNSPLETQEETS